MYLPKTLKNIYNYSIIYRHLKREEINVILLIAVMLHGKPNKTTSSDIIKKALERSKLD